MEITKRYTPRSINFHLLPDQMERVKSSVKEFYQGKSWLPNLSVSFSLTTISQTAETREFEEFRELVRNLSEPILSLDALVNINTIRFNPDKEYSWPVFRFNYRQDSIEISLGGDSATNIQKHLSEIEELFSLETVKPKALDEEARDPKRTVFVAHSFDQRGKSYAYELNKFLTLIGFEVSTGEGFSPESVSRKVKRRLTAQEVVIVIASQREDVTWITQETAGASFIGKPIILLIEKGVELKPGVLGDLEYIEFHQDNISTTFTPILEGMQELGYKFK